MRAPCTPSSGRRGRRGLWAAAPGRLSEGGVSGARPRRVPSGLWTSPGPAGFPADLRPPGRPPPSARTPQGTACPWRGDQAAPQALWAAGASTDRRSLRARPPGERRLSRSPGAPPRGLRSAQEHGRNEPVRPSDRPPRGPGARHGPRHSQEHVRRETPRVRKGRDRELWRRSPHVDPATARRGEEGPKVLPGNRRTGGGEDPAVHGPPGTARPGLQCPARARPAGPHPRAEVVRGELRGQPAGRAGPPGATENPAGRTTAVPAAWPVVVQTQRSSLRSLPAGTRVCPRPAWSIEAGAAKARS